jgi:hypothetical protein
VDKPDKEVAAVLHCRNLRKSIKSALSACPKRNPVRPAQSLPRQLHFHIFTSPHFHINISGLKIFTIFA